MVGDGVDAKVQEVEAILAQRLAEGGEGLQVQYMFVCINIYIYIYIDIYLYSFLFIYLYLFRIKGLHGFFRGDIGMLYKG